MSVLNAVFQALVRALTWVFPLSESGHLGVLNDFSGRADGSVYALTGVIHIGIALGIVLAMYRLFFQLSGEVVFCVKDIAHKQFHFQQAGPAKRFLLMNLLAFVPLLLWAIPMGKYGLLFKILHLPASNNTLLDEGILLAVTGGMLFWAAQQMKQPPARKQVTAGTALLLGGAMVICVAVAGMAPVAIAFSLLLLMGISVKYALKFAFALSTPVLLIAGIVEICIADISAGAAEIIAALPVSVIVSFFSVKGFKWIIKKRSLPYFAYYDMAFGGIIAVVGIVQLIVR